MMPYCNYNGNIYDSQRAVIHPDSRALLFGEGLIETALWEQGHIALWNYHYKRLTESAGIFHIGMREMTSAFLLEEINKTTAVNNVTTSCVIRLEVFKYNKERRTGFLINCRPVPLKANIQPQLGIAHTVIKSADSISHIKSSSRLIYIRAMHEAAANGWEDALLLNQYGRIAESTICNIFWKEGDVLYTPPLSEGCVAGVYRAYLLDLGTFNSCIIKEALLSRDILNAAEEIYLGNAVRGMQTVHLKDI